MKCYVHPDVEAQAACTRCGRAVCADCAVNVGGRFVCRECVAAQAQAAQGPVAETNTLAVVSLLVGLLGLLACVCAGSFGGLPIGAAAIVFGYLARQQIADQQNVGSSSLLANLGIGLGAAEVILSVLFLLGMGSLSFLAVLSQLASRG